jgi:hypothetical protein
LFLAYRRFIHETFHPSHADLLPFEAPSARIQQQHLLQLPLPSLEPCSTSFQQPICSGSPTPHPFRLSPESSLTPALPPVLYRPFAYGFALANSRRPLWQCSLLFEYPPTAPRSLFCISIFWHQLLHPAQVCFAHTCCPLDRCSLMSSCHSSFLCPWLLQCPVALLPLLTDGLLPLECCFASNIPNPLLFQSCRMISGKSPDWSYHTEMI